MKRKTDLAQDYIDNSLTRLSQEQKFDDDDVKDAFLAGMEKCEENERISLKIDSLTEEEIEEFRQKWLPLLSVSHTYDEGFIVDKSELIKPELKNQEEIDCIHGEKPEYPDFTYNNEYVSTDTATIQDLVQQLKSLP